MGANRRGRVVWSVFHNPAFVTFSVNVIFVATVLPMVRYGCCSVVPAGRCGCRNAEVERQCAPDCCDYYDILHGIISFPKLRTTISCGKSCRDCCVDVGISHAFIPLLHGSSCLQTLLCCRQETPFQWCNFYGQGMYRSRQNQRHTPYARLHS